MGWDIYGMGYIWDGIYMRWDTIHGMGLCQIPVYDVNSNNVFNYYSNNTRYKLLCWVTLDLAFKRQHDLPVPSL